MAPSNVLTGEMIQFTATSKLSCFSMLLLLTSALAQLNDSVSRISSTCDGIRISRGSALEWNLGFVLDSLVKNVNKTGYNISSYGENGVKVYGIAQCRADLNASSCKECVSHAKEDLGGLCGNISGSINYVEEGCFLRYDTEGFYSQLYLNMGGGNSGCGLSNGTSVDDSSGFLSNLMDDAVSSNVGFSTLKEKRLYGLAQCWINLTMDQCKQCLHSFDGGFPPSCPKGQGVRDTCLVRFAPYAFYGDVAPSPLLSPRSGSGPSIPPSNGPSLPSIPPSNGPSILPSNGPSLRSIPPLSRLHISLTERIRQLKRGLAIGGVVLVLLLLGLLVIWKRKVIQRLCKKPLPDDRNPHELLTAMSKSKLHYRYQALQTATNNFNPVNKIGQGGFGSVYKGILPNGTEIAVKRLLTNREQSVSDFFNEVNLISNVQHKNLVKLLGFSVAGTERLLVYEYLPNKSLDHFLFDENLGRLLDWQRRFEIILGTAGGLTYLHQESDTRIIHRDIKASNILLDQHFKAKIADFGLVRYFAEDQTHLSTTIVGTRGYMAPEYLVHGHLTEKVDVYAFGVLVLEIISGRKNKTPMHVNDTPSLLTEVWNNYLSGTLSNVIDPNIQENYEELQQVVHVALLCTQVSARLRPSMSKVIVFLTTKNPSLPAPTQPPFIDVDSSQSNTNTSIVPEPETYNSVSNVAMPPATPMSLNTISTSSFGPR